MSFDDDFEFGDGYQGVQESAIPETPPNQQSKPAQAQQSKFQDPNVTVQKPNVSHNKNYDAQASSGARHGRTEQVQQGYSQPGQSVQRQSNGQQQQTIQQPRQQQQQRQVQQGTQSRQSNINQRPQNAEQRRANVPQPNAQQVQQVPNQQQVKKKKSKLPIIIVAIVLVVIVGVVAAKLFLGGTKLVAQEQTYEGSGRYALDVLQNAINNYDATAIDAIVGTEDGDSYLGQEWAYVNGVKLRQEFIQKVGALVSFEYPQVQQLSTTGVGMTNADGSAIMIESYMNAGESITVTIPDYNKLAATMDEDITYIQQMFKSSKYSEADYTWYDEMANLMLQYICDKDSIPTTTIELTLSIRLSTSGQPYIEDDALLDDALFGSDEFHDMCAKFSQLCLGWTGYKDEHYTEQELQHNTEYDEWLELFLTYFEADGGVYDKATGTFSNVQKAYNKSKSKWEPWYLRNSENEIQKNEDGTYIVNYFSVKDENGKDWIQPDEQILVDVDKVRQVEDPWVEETGILYNWLGCNYIQNKYKGIGDTVVRVGDGSIDSPAGIGTTIITKMLCNDGKYHDVRVALIGYWTEQDAIDYAEKFSTKNRGFTTSSVVQLICYEIQIENLESEDITFTASEMTLADKNTNISSRTGTMYGFSETVTIKAGETTIINDWATSTELAQKYVCWGKNFGRTYSMVYFDVLAGTGNIPTYSAYEQFTGKSSLSSSN